MIVLDILAMFLLATLALFAVAGTGRMALHAGALALRAAGRADPRTGGAGRARGVRHHLLAAAIGAGLVAMLIADSTALGASLAAACLGTFALPGTASLAYFGLRS